MAPAGIYDMEFRALKVHTDPAGELGTGEIPGRTVVSPSADP